MDFVIIFYYLKISKYSYYDRYIERAKQFSKLRNKEGPYCGTIYI